MDKFKKLYLRNFFFLALFAAFGTTTATTAEPLTLRDQMGIQAGDTLESPAFEPELVLVRNMGFRHTRLHDSWGSVRRTQQASNNWSSFDPILGIHKQMGIEPMVLLAYGVDWASSAPKGTTDDWTLRTYPPDIAEYAAHARDWARRYQGQPISFEIWNEPDGSTLFWKGSAEHYAAMMKAAYVAIKGVNSNIPVVMAGPSGSNINYAENLLLRLGGDLYSDAITIHPYGLKPEEFSLLIEKMHMIANKCTQPKQLWLTEWAFFSPHHPTMEQSDLEDIANQYVRASLLCFLHGIDRNYTFCLMRVPELALVVAKDGKPSPRPAYYAMKEMMDNLGDLPLIGTVQIDREKDIYILVFRANNCKTATIAFWTTGNARQVTLPGLAIPLQISPKPQYLSGLTISDNIIHSVTILKHSIPSPAIPLDGWVEAPTETQYMLVGDTSTLKIRGRINNNLDHKVDAQLRLNLPNGWTCSTPNLGVALDRYESKWLTFQVAPPQNPQPGPLKGIELVGKIDSVLLLPQAVPVHINSGLGITAIFEPVSINNGQMTLAVTLRGNHPKNLKYQLHPARNYYFPVMRGIVTPNDNQIAIPLNIRNARSREEPVYITFSDNTRSQVVSAYLDFPMAMPIDQVLLDGRADEWQGSFPVHINSCINVPANSASAWNGPQDTSAIVRTAYNNQGLYFAIDVTDDNVLPNRRGSVSWNGDCVELFLSTQNRQHLDKPTPSLSSGDMQFLLPALPNPTQGDKTFINCRFIGGGQAEGILPVGQLEGNAVTKMTSYGYFIEAFIPWSSLPQVKPVPGTTMGFDLAIDDDDSGVGRKLQMQWRSGLNIHSTVEKYGTITLLGPDQIVLSTEPSLEFNFKSPPPLGGTGVKMTKAALISNQTAQPEHNQVLHLTMEPGRYYVEMELFSTRMPTLAPGFVPESLTIELNGHSPPKGLKLRIMDQQGEFFQNHNSFELSKYSSKMTDGNQFTIPLTPGSAFSQNWGGNNDRKIDLPLQLLSIIIEQEQNDNANDFIISKLNFQ